jgi:RimJ/RimL family protein N-acetyltransferase
MEPKFDFVEVTLKQEDYNKVKEVYRLHKEQSRKIFDLSCGISTDEQIMDYIKDKVEYELVLLAIDKETNNYAGCIIFEDITLFDNEIVKANVHIVVNKKYWGQNSRQIIFDCYKYMKENMKPFKRLEAYVPANNFGIIKLLKDVGFKVEGTLKNRLVFNNKNNIPTYYNELVYSNLNIGE